MAVRTQIQRVELRAVDNATAPVQASARKIAAASRDLQRELRATQAASTSAERAIQRFGRTAGQSATGARSASEAVRALSRSLEGVVASSPRAAAAQHKSAAASRTATVEARRLGTSMRGTAAMMVGGAGIGYAFGSIVTAAGGFEQAVKSAGAVSNIEGKKLEQLGLIARRVGLATAFGATEAAKGAAELARGGVAIADVSKGALKASLDLARAGGTDVPRAANLMSKAITSYKLSGKDAGLVADLFTNASNKTAASVEEFIAAFQQGGGIAKQAGFDINETVLAMTVLAKGAVVGSDAGTSLKSAMTQLAAPSTKAEETMHKYGISVRTAGGEMKSVAELADTFNKGLGGLGSAERTGALKDIAGTDGIRALIAFMEVGGAGALKLRRALGEEGTAALVAAKQMQTYEGSVARLKAAREDASIAAGTPLIGGLADIGEAAVRALQSPGVTRALDSFGRNLGERGSKIADGFTAAAEDGRLAGTFDDALSLMDAVADSASAIAKATGMIASAWQAIPGPIRESGVQALVFAAVLKRVAALGGLAGGASLLGGGGGAASAGRRGLLTGAGTSVPYQAGQASAVSQMGHAGGITPLVVKNNTGMSRGAVLDRPSNVVENVKRLREVAAQSRGLERSARESAVALDEAERSLARADEAERVVQKRHLAASTIYSRRSRATLASASAIEGQARAALTDARADLTAARGPSGERSSNMRQVPLVRGVTNATETWEAARSTRIETQARLLAETKARHTAASPAITAAASNTLGQTRARDAARAEAEAQRSAAALAKREQQALRERTRVETMRAGRRGGGLGAVAGVGAAALAGGDMMTSVTTGAMVGGSMGGPWGAAGGAIAAAAGSGLIKFFKGRAEDNARELGEAAGKAVAESVGKNLSSSTQKVLTDLKAAADKAIAARDGDPTPNKIDGAVAASKKLGQGIGAAGVKSLRGKTITPTTLGIAKDLLNRSMGEEPEARKAAAVPYIAYVRELEKQGKLAKGATARFVRQIGDKIEVAKDVSVKTQLRVDLKEAAGDIRKKIIRQIRGGDNKLAGLTIPVTADFDIEKVLSTARKRRAELNKIANDPGRSKKERDAAKADSAALSKSIGAFAKATVKANADSAAAAQKNAEATRRANDAVTRSWERRAAAALLSSQTEGGSVLDLTTLEPVPEAPKPKTHKRRGGRLRFQGGGFVHAAVSPGEEILDAHGGSLGIVPGSPTAADSVEMMLPHDGTVLTWSGRAIRDNGGSVDDAVNYQVPHFQNGGPVNGAIGPSRAAAAFRKAKFRGNDLVTMTAIAGAESKYRPGVVSPPNNDPWKSRDHGLAQINDHWWPQFFKTPGQILTADYNAKAAKVVKDKQGFGAWSTYAAGLHKSYLPGARAGAQKANGGAGTFGDTSIEVPIMLGRSKYGRTPLVEDAFGQGFSRASGGTTIGSEYRTKRGIGRSVMDALTSVQTTRTSNVSGGGTDATAGTPGRGGWTRPTATGSITSKFGNRSSPGGIGSTNHDGVDIGVPVGTPVYAARAGKVTRAGVNGGYGTYVGIDHAKGYSSFYGHLSKLSTSVGKKVKAGATIAKSGNTGNSTGAHLHFGIHRNGAKVDPSSVMSFRRGGRIPSYRSGTAKVKATSSSYDRNADLRTVVAGGNRGNRQWAEALADAVDMATTTYVDKVRVGLQKTADGAGSKLAISRAQAALAIVDDRLGARAGSKVAAAAGDMDARAKNLATVQTMQRIRGTVDTPGAYRDQAEVENRFLAKAGGNRARLNDAIKIADKSKDAEASRSAREALQAFESQVLESKASLVELDQSTARAGRRTGWAESDANLALAQLTPSTVDDQAAYARQQTIAEGGLASAIAAKDTADITEWAGILKGIRDAIDQGNAEAKAASDAAADLAKTMADNEAARLRLLGSYDLASVLAAVVSNKIAGGAEAVRGYPKGWAA